MHPKLRLTAASAPLTHEVEARDEFGQVRRVSIPAERALTVFVDKRELVTLMTLGAAPELLVLGYLRNQRLVDNIHDIESITVDWDVDAAAVKTRAGIERFDEKTAKRVVTTGCGQGTVFGDLMGNLDSVHLPSPQDPAARISQAALYGLLNAMRLQDSTYKSAGSVHGCALFRQDELLTFIEDVGRHNAIDTIAGWMWLHGVDGSDKSFYTTGRLTSEMVIKSAQMGVPIVVSRSGITQMGHEMATRLGLALFGRATNRHFICYCGFDRFDAAPEPTRDAPAVAGHAGAAGPAGAMLPGGGASGNQEAGPGVQRLGDPGPPNGKDDDGKRLQCSSPPPIGTGAAEAGAASPVHASTVRANTAPASTDPANAAPANTASANTGPTNTAPTNTDPVNTALTDIDSGGQGAGAMCATPTGAAMPQSAPGADLSR